MCIWKNIPNSSILFYTMCTHGEQLDNRSLWYVRHLYLAWNKSTQMAISLPSMQKKAVRKFCWCEMVLAHAGWRRNSWRDVFCLPKLLSISCRRSCHVWEYTNSWFFCPLCCKWHSISDGACYCMTGLLVVLEAMYFWLLLRSGLIHAL